MRYYFACVINVMPFLAYIKHVRIDYISGIYQCMNFVDVTFETVILNACCGRSV